MCPLYSAAIDRLQEYLRVLCMLVANAAASSATCKSHSSRIILAWKHRCILPSQVGVQLVLFGMLVLQLPAADCGAGNMEQQDWGDNHWSSLWLHLASCDTPCAGTATAEASVVAATWTSSTRTPAAAPTSAMAPARASAAMESATCCGMPLTRSRTRSSSEGCTSWKGLAS